MTQWTNSSVLALAGNRDPIEAVLEAARDLVRSALDNGWTGPPFDPLWLADFLNVSTMPRDDVYDARVVPLDSHDVQIEYNPNRPRARRRFSIAHEIAHLLFPDHREAIRNREQVDRALTDDWQLEILCNLAAAEFLMPTGMLDESSYELPTIELLETQRRRFDVSMEAMLLRVARVTDESIAVFAGSRIDPMGISDAYRIDYSVGSRTWNPKVPTGTALESAKVLAECTAIGYTAKSAREEWPSDGTSHQVECIGVPPFPGHRFPRVVGIMVPVSDNESINPSIRYVIGDASQPRDSGNRIILHIVNDKARAWGGQFAAALSEKWPAAADDYSSSTTSCPKELTLGNARVSTASEDVFVASLVAQHGYGPSRKPRIRYIALKESLIAIAPTALRLRASIHMPRIGTGQAGGDWTIIEDLIIRELVDHGLDVTVYDPPWSNPRSHQRSLPLGL